MLCNVNEVVLDSDQRLKHINHLRQVEGLTDENIRKLIEKYKNLLTENAGKGSTVAFLNDILDHLDKTGYIESPDSCYSGLALTGVKGAEKDALLEDHFLIKEAIQEGGVQKNYDPAEAPFNPQEQLVGEPQEVSDIDTLMVISSMFFTGTNLAASTGLGTEIRTANIYNKFPIEFVKKGIYVSRMGTGARRVIVLEYQDLKKQKPQVVDVIGRLREFSPGVGTCPVHGNTLVGFRDGQTTCLPGLIQKEFPQFNYDFSHYQK
ncbi:hypothetical protein KY306_02285 [Candidatus Woesearchaeota archaeon]|nr:hypothetical protein [Candidatus Woesearchaeota archaeon]